MSDPSPYCPKCENELQLWVGRTPNGLHRIVVECPRCVIRKEWFHSMWEEDYLDRALTDFNTLVEMGKEYED